MTRKVVLLAALVGSIAMASPAFAWTYVGGRDYSKPPSSTTTTTSTTSGGSHSVPEPGMLGLFGGGLIALGFARRRLKRR